MRRLEIISVISATAAVLLLVGWVVAREQIGEPMLIGDPEVRETASSTPATSTLVNLYYYNPEADINESGELGCTRAGLTAVPRRLSLGDNLPERALEELFTGKLTDSERASGVTTEFPLADLTIVGVSVRADGTAVVALDDPGFRTSGGACRVNVLRAQVEETLQQFPSVAAVEFLPENLFQP